jgi:flagellar hook protein FlgE
MGLFGAMTASVSGLSAQGQAISVISDNLSNTNTTGYKASRSLFKQLVTTSGVGGTTYNAGGTAPTIGRDQKAQGSLTSTSSVTDLAITGNGFFRVASDNVLDNNTTFFYTRAGSFAEDKEGFLVNPDGYYLQGWRTDSDGNIANVQNLSNIELQSVGVSAQETKELRLGINLNSSTPIGNAFYNTATGLTASLNNVLNSTSADVYIADARVFDAQGTARDISIAFSKRGANFWDFQVYTDGANIQGGVPGQETRIGTGGTLRFNPGGSLKYATGTTLTPQWGGGSPQGSITLDMGDYSGGQIATAAAGATFTDHVLDIAVEDNTFASGTYTLRRTSATTMGLYNAAGTVLIENANIGASGVREAYFATSKIRMTVSNNFDETAGAYPSTVGQFTVNPVAQLDQGLANDGIVQFAASNNTSFVNQNGFGTGVLSSIQIDEEGFVAGSFTNGETKRLYKVALGLFQNPNGLEPVSGSLLRVTDASGQALIKEAGTGSAGRIVSGTLEGSTTDIAGEFSQMIVAQRSFQASSKVITTVDQMLNELLQLR